MVEHELLAPCVAVVGPANSGKTTLLHQLDAFLQRHSSRPQVYVVKGSPDATGRYLYWAPEGERKKLERVAKGKWTLGAVECICFWTLSARRNLELVLLDFGGRHSPVNPMILSCCTHYLLLSRSFGKAEKAKQEESESWELVCREQGLQPLARIRSLIDEGDMRITVNPGDGVIEANYRPDRATPEDATNQSVIEAIGKWLLSLRVARTSPLYLDLRLDRDWSIEDLKDLAGLEEKLRTIVSSKGRLRLGGRAPIWAYAAAMHRALDCRQDTIIEQFEPKMPGGFVRIPDVFAGKGVEFPSGFLETGYEQREGQYWLNLSIPAVERMLPITLALGLHAMPLPDPLPPPGSAVVVSGVVPAWLHLAYSRWLRNIDMRPIAIWDGRGRAVQVHPVAKG